MAILCLIFVPLSLTDDVAVAESLYKEKNYEEAIEIYSQMIDEGINDALIYYNLGNCYFKAGNLGEAILNYKRAKRLLPSDNDVNFNLDFARSQRVDVLVVSGRPGFVKFIVELPGRFSLNGLTMFSSSIFFVIFILLILSLFCKKRIFYRIVVGLSVLFICSAILLSISIRNRNIDEGVLITSAQAVGSGPGEDYSLLFTLHEGAEFRILEEDGEWARIVLEPGLTGWLGKKSFKKV